MSSWKNIVIEEPSTAGSMGGDYIVENTIGKAGGHLIPDGSSSKVFTRGPSDEVNRLLITSGTTSDTQGIYKEIVGETGHTFKNAGGGGFSMWGKPFYAGSDTLINNKLGPIGCFPNPTGGGWAPDTGTFPNPLFFKPALNGMNWNDNLWLDVSTEEGDYSTGGGVAPQFAGGGYGIDSSGSYSGTALFKWADPQDRGFDHALNNGQIQTGTAGTSVAGGLHTGHGYVLEDVRMVVNPGNYIVDTAAEGIVSESVHFGRRDASGDVIEYDKDNAATHVDITAENSTGGVTYTGPSDGNLQYHAFSSGSWTVSGDIAQEASDTLSMNAPTGTVTADQMMTGLEANGNGTGLRVNKAAASEDTQIFYSCVFNKMNMLHLDSTAHPWFESMPATQADWGKWSGVDCFNQAAVDAGRLYIPLDSITISGLVGSVASEFWDNVAGFTHGDFVPLWGIFNQGVDYTSFGGGNYPISYNTSVMDGNFWINAWNTFSSSTNGTPDSYYDDAYTYGTGVWAGGFNPTSPLNRYAQWESNGSALNWYGKQLFKYVDTTQAGVLDTDTGPRLEFNAGLDNSGSGGTDYSSHVTGTVPSSFGAGITLGANEVSVYGNTFSSWTDEQVLAEMVAQIFNKTSVHWSSYHGTHGSDFVIEVASGDKDRCLLFRSPNANSSSMFIEDRTALNGSLVATKSAKVMLQDSTAGSDYIGTMGISGGKPTLRIA
jgi:hypothetical protein